MPSFVADVEEGAVAKGIVIEDGEVIWTCEHAHYRPNANSRYSRDENRVWEASAMNCARAAVRQMRNKQVVRGDIGLYGDTLELDLRDDHRLIVIDGLKIWGRVFLRDDGDRALEVWRNKDSRNDPPMVGDQPHPEKRITWNIHRSHKTATLPKIEPEDLTKMVEAMFVLERDIWGVKFKHPGRMEPDQDELEQVDSKRVIDLTGKSATGMTPKIQVGRSDEGRRVFEVTGWKGEIVGSFVHRGKAVACLEKVKNV